MSRRTTLPLIWLLCSAALGGCGEPEGKNTPVAPRPHLVELAGAEPGRLTYAADRSGTLRALHEMKVVNQEEGRIVELTVREGDPVAAGQVLARYDDRIARAELDKAEASLAEAEANFERSRRLVAKGFFSAEAMSRATAAQELARAEVRLLQVRLQHMTLTAPRAGVIAARLVEPGDATPQHSHILTLIDPTRLVTDVSVSELVLPRLRVGDTAQVRIDALGAGSYPGRILRIHPTLDPATRSGLVEVALDPLPPGARPGQYCRVVFAAGGEEHLIVPLAALQRDEAGEFVFTYQGDGTVRRVTVSSGLRLADRVEIVDGLAPAARVVVKGFLELADGRQVKPVGPPADAATEGR
ncbi:MAG: efflux transporter periplasmic adaptor subunit [Betaproteobacteria bacterium HGW-Betaproteobacteria-7]|jgi:membrane fusion protein (multidrug efflux system)|nr:MAG: efflux transporter periplasmic adaptor subunit [Betaproteobacteria bacterium HGW-Betaproteobacteria-7]